MLQDRCALKPSANSQHTRTRRGFVSGPSLQVKHFSSYRPSSCGTKQEPEQTRPRDPSLQDQAIRLAQRGDAAAFESIYRRHNRRVYALCLRLARDPVEAEDLTQEAFLQLFGKSTRSGANRLFLRGSTG